MLVAGERHALARVIVDLHLQIHVGGARAKARVDPGLARSIGAEGDPMRKTVGASLVYFAMVLGTGFVLGVLRVPFVVPRLGERWAELAEMPIMAATIFFAAGYVLKRFPEIHLHGRALTTGLLALALAVLAEFGLAVLLQDRTISDYLGSRDRISGSVYLGMLVVFALMPKLRLRYAK